MTCENKEISLLMIKKARTKVQNLQEKVLLFWFFCLYLEIRKTIEGGENLNED
jgi:hypothetical protein